MAERSMPQVMPQTDGFSQVLIQVQGTGERPRQLRGLKGMGETGYVMVTEGSNKDLCLVFQAAERFTVDYAVAVALENGAYRA